MSFRSFTMIDVKEVLRRWQAGQGARQMARESVASRRTVTRYVEAAEACGVTATTPLTDEVVRAVAAGVQQRPEPISSEQRTELERHRLQIQRWLEQEQPLRLVRVHELLARDAGLRASYTTLRRYVHQELGWRERPGTVRVDDPPPGEEVQVDFGAMGFVTGADGKKRRLWVLVVTLSMSRYQFVWPTFLQTVEALCAGLDAAWRFFGGVPARVVLDNMRAAVTRPSAKDPELNRAFAEYAQHCGFFVDPARVRRPQDKPRVENQVAYVRERWFAGEAFSDDLGALRESAARWCRDVAGTRVHGTTRRIPAEVFGTEEQQHLRPAPAVPFDVPRWSSPTVHPDHHVQVLQSLYSVPSQYRGKVEARADRRTVQIYVRFQLVKTHRRVGPGRRATDPADYPVGKAGYATRTVDGLVAQARDLGEHVGRFTEQLLAGPLPWTKMRQAYGLLRLCERYGATRVDACCARSLAFGVLDVPRIERMLKQARAAEETAPGRVVPLPTSRFARSPSAFATVPTKGGE